MDARISVIVPIYNAERTLARCVNSLVHQTHGDMDIILVDDGSADGSLGICREFEQKYGNVTVIHKANGGAASARNAGLLTAKGAFIGFVDSDDWVAPDMYAHLYQLICKHNADAARINVRNVRGEQFNIANTKEKVDKYTGKDILQYYMDAVTTTGCYGVVRFLFKRQVLNGIAFRQVSLNEDLDYMYKALANCNMFVVSNAVKYFVFRSGHSLSTGGFNRKDYDSYAAADALCQLTEPEEYGTIRFLGRVKRARTPFTHLCKIAYQGVSDPSIDKRKTVKELTKEHRKNAGMLLVSPMSFNRKVMAVMLWVHFKTLEIPLFLYKKLSKGGIPV
jgi:glycosyltransferase involved in cell wall biosynthesis